MTKPQVKKKFYFGILHFLSTMTIFHIQWSSGQQFARQWRQPSCFTWSNLLVVVMELDDSECEALDLIPLITNIVLEDHASFISFFHGQCFLTLTDHSCRVVSLQLLANNKLASGLYDGKIQIWNIDTGECIRTLKADYGLTSLQFLSNNQLASGSELRSLIKILNVDSGECISELSGLSQIFLFF